MRIEFEPVMPNIKPSIKTVIDLTSAWSLVKVPGLFRGHMRTNLAAERCENFAMSCDFLRGHYLPKQAPHLDAFDRALCDSHEGV